MARLLALMAVSALALSTSCGALGILYYIPVLGTRLEDFGLLMPQLRAMHTTFALAWVFLGPIAFMDDFLPGHYSLPENKTRRWRRGLRMLCWIAAGAGAAITLPLGIFSGREYVEYHSVVSLLIFCGWLEFAADLWRRARVNFWKHPAYIYMWVAGAFLFLYSYAEAHLWALDFFFSRPIRDMQIQWKSIGTLAGSFNLLVYGTSLALHEELTGDCGYAKSKTAFSLLFVGMLNTLTNYVHHTYHLPQGEAQKWFAFIVSMSEIGILLKILADLARGLSQRSTKQCLARSLLSSTRWWTAANLILAILISVPPFNALIHGTQVVMAHAMGSMIGIDSTVILAAMAYLASRSSGTEIPAAPKFALCGFHVSLACLLLSLTISGGTKGVFRYLNQELPIWHSSMFPLSAFFGLCLSIFILRLSFLAASGIFRSKFLTNS